GGELDDIPPAGTDRLQRGLAVGEHLDALSVEIVDADDPALAVGRKLARDVDRFRRLDPRDLRVLPERLAEHVRAEDLDLGHRGSLLSVVIAGLVPAIPILT